MIPDIPKQILETRSFSKYTDLRKRSLKTLIRVYVNEGPQNYAEHIEVMLQKKGGRVFVNNHPRVLRAAHRFTSLAVPFSLWEC